MEVIGDSQIPPVDCWVVVGSCGMITDAVPFRSFPEAGACIVVHFDPSLPSECTHLQVAGFSRHATCTSIVWVVRWLERLVLAATAFTVTNQVWTLWDRRILDCIGPALSDIIIPLDVVIRAPFDEKLRLQLCDTDGPIRSFFEGASCFKHSLLCRDIQVREMASP